MPRLHSQHGYRFITVRFAGTIKLTAVFVLRFFYPFNIRHLHRISASQQGWILLSVLLLSFLLSTPHTATAQNLNEATSLNKRAVELYQAGRYSEAIPLVQRLLAMREKAFGLNHPEVAGLLNNLALLYADQGRYADAELLYKRSLAIREKAFGPDHPDVAESTHSAKRQLRWPDTTHGVPTSNRRCGVSWRRSMPN
jgi:tetratricopeptide (TPR) repeat protein